MDKDLEKFLEEECKAGDYVAFTMMVNKKYAEDLIKHINEFYTRCAIVGGGAGGAKLLGKDNEDKGEGGLQ
jgi:hypothetical protein